MARLSTLADATLAAAYRIALGQQHVGARHGSP
jgi:hypothetical protein